MITTTRRRRIVIMPCSLLLYTNAPAHRAFNLNSQGNISLHFTITQTTSL